MKQNRTKTKTKIKQNKTKTEQQKNKTEQTRVFLIVGIVLLVGVLSSC